MKTISVKPLQKEDKEKARALEKLFNYYFDKLVEIEEFREKFARQIIFGEDISKEELEGYFKKIIKNA